MHVVDGDFNLIKTRGIESILVVGHVLKILYYLLYKNRLKLSRLLDEE